MTTLRYYEAPQGFTPDGFVEPTTLPHTIRVIAPPNARSIHALAGAISRDLGATHDLYTKANGQTVMMSTAAARSLAHGVTDFYLAAAEDLTRPAIFELIDFTGLTGAHLHLVFSYGQVHTHAHTLNEVGFTHTPFGHLPTALAHPHTNTVNATTQQPAPEQSWDDIDLPPDPWMSFRAACRATLPRAAFAQVDRLYLAAYTAARASDARTAEEIAALTGHIWQQHGTDEAARIIVSRAIQAAMFRNGLLVRLDHHLFTRHVQLRHVNLMTPEHYTQLGGFLNPWRAAATVLHAHHVTTEQALALTTTDVTPDGNIPHLGITLPPEARRLIATQRWHQLLTRDADPPLFNSTTNGLRQGIRRVVAQLDLPLIPYWRTLRNDKGRTNMGIRVEAIT